MEASTWRVRVRVMECVVRARVGGRQASGERQECLGGEYLEGDGRRDRVGSEGEGSQG